MGLVPTFSRIATKQLLLHGFACEIPRCYCRVRKFSNKSELRVRADFGVGENDQLLIREKQRPLILRAWSLIGVQNVLVKSWKSFLFSIINISVPFCVGLTFISPLYKVLDD